MTDRSDKARSTAGALCLGAAITAVIAVLLFTGTIDLGLDEEARRLLVGLLAVVTVMDLGMAWFMYVRISGRK